MPEHSEPRSEPPSEAPSEPPAEEAATPVPNRRERRGNKSAAAQPQYGKGAVGRNRGPVPNARQYSTRRRGG